MQAGLEGVLRSAGLTEVAGQGVAVGAEVTRLSEGTEASGTARRGEGAIRSGESLRASGAGLSTESGAQGHCDADLRAARQIRVRIDFIDSTHLSVLVFPLFLNSG